MEKKSAHLSNVSVLVELPAAREYKAQLKAATETKRASYSRNSSWFEKCKTRGLYVVLAACAGLGIAGDVSRPMESLLFSRRLSDR
jgi:hypothetical protein